VKAIIPNLWFDMFAEEAAEFYCSIFPNSKIIDRAYYTEGSPGPAGTVMSVTFQLNGQEYVGINGGPQFPFTEAVSLAVECDDQVEIDRYWEQLLAGGGTESVCGWLKDKYGFSWQVVPKTWMEYAAGDDPEKVKRAMDAMLKMVKFDIAELERAYNG